MNTNQSEKYHLVSKLKTAKRQFFLANKNYFLDTTNQRWKAIIQE
jgi:hypothetical protein